MVAPFVPIDRDSAALGTLIDPAQVAGLPLDGRNFLELALLAPGTVPAPQGSASSVRGRLRVQRQRRPRGRERATCSTASTTWTRSWARPVSGRRSTRSTSSASRPPPTTRPSVATPPARSTSSPGPARIASRHRLRVLPERCARQPERVRAAATSRRPTTTATSSAARSAARSRPTGCSFSPTTRARGCAKGSPASPTCRRSPSGRATFRSRSSRRRVDPFSGQPFPGGRIPSFVLSPIGSAIAALYPLPNRSTPFANYVASPTSTDDVDQFDGRVDHAFAERLAADRRDTASAIAACSSRSRGAGFSTRARLRQSTSIAAVRTSRWPTAGRWAARCVNDVRFGYNRVAIGVFPENPQIDNAAVGLKPLATNPRDDGLSLISIAGYSALGQEYNNPQASTSNTYPAARHGDLGRAAAHLVKFGGELLRRPAVGVPRRAGARLPHLRRSGLHRQRARGPPARPAGADRRRAAGQPAEPARPAWSAFAHDDWRVLPSLTVSAGLRYDYMSPPVDADDRANLYDAATGQLVAVGTNGMPRGGYEPDRNNLAPRVGLAWTLDQRGPHGAAGRLRHLLQPGGAGDLRGALLQSAVLQPERLLPRSAAAAAHARGSVPVVVPGVHSAVGDGLPARSADAVDGALERQRAATATARRARSRSPTSRSRGHDLISARDLNQAAGQPGQPNLRPNPLFADITLIESRASSEYDALQITYQQRAARVCRCCWPTRWASRPTMRRGSLRARVIRTFPQNSLDPAAEQGRSSFDVRNRFSASFAYELPLGTNVVAARHRSPGHRHHPERPAVHRRAAAGPRQQQHRPIEPRLRLQRSAERHRRRDARQPDGRRSGSTRRRFRCRRSARSATPAATS